ncbi:MAG: prohibitin family protein [Cyanobacteria bacterium P01_G01_bin.54]
MMSKLQDRLKTLSPQQLLVSSIAGLAIAIIGGTLLIRGIKIISTGSVGVLEVAGTVAKEPLPPGMHWVNPWGNVEIYSTQIQDIKETIEATSKEGLGFNVDVSLQYHIAPDYATEVYKTIGKDEQEIVISRFRSIVRMITARYPAEAIYSEKRQELSEQLQIELKQSLEPLGFVLDGVFIREVMLPPSLQQAIQEKINEEQAGKQMAFKLEQERQEAERKRIEAQGKADAREILAQKTTPEILQIRSLEILEKLVESGDNKVIILGSGDDPNMPLMLRALNIEPSPQGQAQE